METKKRGRPPKIKEPIVKTENKKRGRPKKIVTEPLVPKEKGKRGRPSKTERMRAIEKEFNLTESLVEELGSISDNIQVIDNKLPAIINSTNNELINFDVLKQDFGLVRNSIINLMATGQTILNTACLLDISDLKASQLEALSNLQSTLGGNIKLLLDCYKTMSDIEKSKVKAVEKPSSINNGEVINNNILFNGSSSELLDMISNQNKG
jgi:hypothetical protein